MNASPLEIFITSAAIILCGVGFALFGWLVRVVSGLVKITQPLSSRQKAAIGVSFFGVVVGGFAIAVGFLGILVAAFLWIKLSYFSELTPRSLAIVSIVVGVLPLLFSFFGMGITKLLGGRADGNGVHVKPIFGVDLSAVLTTLLMMHWLTIFSGGLAMLGLMASGVWAVFF